MSCKIPFVNQMDSYLVGIWPFWHFVWTNSIEYSLNGPNRLNSHWKIRNQFQCVALMSVAVGKQMIMVGYNIICCEIKYSVRKVSTWSGNILAIVQKISVKCRISLYAEVTFKLPKPYEYRFLYIFRQVESLVINPPGGVWQCITRSNRRRPLGPDFYWNIMCGIISNPKHQ